jgi:hypothetical protein
MWKIKLLLMISYKQNSYVYYYAFLCNVETRVLN